MPVAWTRASTRRVETPAGVGLGDHRLRPLGSPARLQEPVREVAALRLVQSLNNLSLRLADLRRREPALEAIQEAADVDRRLAGARPNAAARPAARSIMIHWFDAP